jgi:Dolichyl-phosphate-mannose-protein mannosyltransferase
MLYVICLLYLAMSAIFGSLKLDNDEFTFVREPYELIGGDYTTGYLKQHNYTEAAKTLLKSYYFYWRYRPLFSPIISVSDRKLFQAQELEFGYTKPPKASNGDRDSLTKYNSRLIVPEPDRFYSHGAGKPLLAPIISIPQLALVKSAAPEAKSLLYYQYNYNYHPIFILTRLAQILSGLATILIVYWILVRECDRRKALFGAAITALFPTCIKFFPNLHHDSILVPFLVLSLYWLFKARYKRAGITFGLALAVKNVAIIVVPVFLVYAIGNAWRAGGASGAGERTRLLREELKGLAMTMVMGLLVLIPFANPVSYVSEILTPITHRAHDVRGEDVDQFTLSGRLSAPDSGASEAVSAARPEVRLIKLLLRLEDNNFFFLMIAVLSFWSHQRNPLARIAFLVILFALPYGLEFGAGLNYRSLLFVPFFAIVCADLFPRKYLLGFVGVLVLVDLVYCTDPMTTDDSHNPVNRENFWMALGSSITTR